MFRITSIVFSFLVLLLSFYFQVEDAHAEDDATSRLSQALERIDSTQALSDRYSYFEKEIFPILIEMKFLEDAEKRRFVSSALATKFSDHTLSLAGDLVSESDTSVRAELARMKSVYEDLFPNAYPGFYKLRKLEEMELDFIGCLESKEVACVRDVIKAGSANYISPKRVSSLMEEKLELAKRFPLLSISMIIRSKEASSLEKGNNALETCGFELDGTSPDATTRRDFEKDITVIEKTLPRVGADCKSSILEALLKPARGYCSGGFLSECVRLLAFLDNQGLESDVADLKKAFILSDEGVTHSKISRLLLTKKVLSKFSIGERFAVLMRGLLPAFVYYAIGGMLLVIFILIYLFLFHSGFLENLGYAIGDRVSALGSKKEKDDHKITINHQDEYSALLEVFGLDDSATNAQIKKAYRMMIKELHPDTNDTESIQRFERVQKAYERLMELRSGWFGLSK